VSSILIDKTPLAVTAGVIT